MKIAYVVGYVPNLIRTRPYNFIKQLANLGHEVSVFALGSGTQDLHDMEDLRSCVAKVYYREQPTWYSLWNCLLTVLSRRPLQTVYSWNPNMARQLVDLLRIPGMFDVVHVEHLRASFYGAYVKSKLPQVPVVWDSVDCISYLYEQASAHSTSGFGKYITRFELDRTRLMERELISELDHVVVTSQKDKNALLELTLPDTKTAPISVVSNGVDLEFFHPNPSVPREEETLVFSGKMSFHANISMVKFLIREIMPRIWIKCPTVRLVVVGKDPPAEIRKLADSSRIFVTGTVSDIRPFLWSATASVVPLVYGTGIQNKILEAMATGTPVITNSKVLGSLSAIPNRDLLVADTPDEFAACTLKLIEDPALQCSLGEAGNHYVRTNHNWRINAQQMADIYKLNLRIST